MGESLPEETDLVSVNPYWVGAGFLEYCVRQGWMVKQQEGKSTRFYCTRTGVDALRQFGIEVHRQEQGQSGSSGEDR